MKHYGVGVIGCGWIFPNHAFPLHMFENTDVKAVCDIKPQALERAAELFKCDAYEDYLDLINRKDIDVIHVLTPHYLHAPMVIAAANAGKHVLTEKPMSITLDDAKAMAAIARQNGVTLGIICQNRYNAPSAAVKRAIKQGNLGKVISQRILVTCAKPERYYQNSDWRGTWEKEGGALLIDQCVHLLDLGRWFVDDDIVSVDATFTNRFHPTIKTEDTAEAFIQYRGGARTVFYATNNASWDAAPIVESHCENGLALLGFDNAQISYVDGNETLTVGNPSEPFDVAEFEKFFGMPMFKVAIDTLNAWGIIGSPIRWKSGVHGPWGLSHFKQIKNFYQSLDEGVKPEIDAEDALKTQEMMCAIYTSAKEGRTVYLSENKKDLSVKGIDL